MTRLVSEAFDAVARQAGERAAIIEDGHALPYSRLLRWSEVISLRLERCQSVPARRVALILPNSAAFVASFFAVARVGGVIAPLNLEYRSQELEHYLTDIDAAAVIVCRAAANLVQDAVKRLARKPALLLVESPECCDVLTAGETPESQDLQSEGSPLLLLYTSGSTGSPKRVVRNHAQLLAEIETLRTLFSVSPCDRFLGATPFCHVNGLVRTMLNATLAGASLYPLQQFARRKVLQLITRERLTFFGGVPQMFVLLAQTPPRQTVDLSSLRTIWSSSAPLTFASNRDFHKSYGLFIRQLYGSTETGTISYNDRLKTDDHLESVGRALSGVGLAVLDEKGNRLPPGREGEIVVSSPFAVSCYQGNPAATEKSFRNGYYLTGDLGFIDSEDCLTLTGRKSLMINRGGYKVNPYEVEEAIRLHPKIAEVAVLGAPGPGGEEIIRCLVVTREHCTPEEIILHCRSRIADYKIPSRIEFRESLPKSPTGKLRRHSL